MKAVIEFMSRSPCDLTVYMDNQACKAFCLRQGVTKASKHFEGRLLWLQDVVQRKVLQMKYVSTHANLGDIHTKPLGPARLQSLLFLHDYVDDCDRFVGENEWNQAHASAMVKARVRHVKQVTGSSSSSWCKKVALLLMMMPVDVEATSGVAFCRYSFVSPIMVFLIFMVIMTSTAAMESNQFSSSGDDTDGWLFVPKPMNYLQSVGAIVAGAVSLLVAWSLGSRFGYASGLEESVASTSTTTDGAVTNGGAIDGTTLVVAILVMTVFYLFKVNYNLKKESLRLREELAGAQQPEASDEDDANDD